MQEVYEQLHNRVPYKMLLQGSGASQNDIINEFKFDTNSVLLAVGSYWEGVSIEEKHCLILLYLDCHFQYQNLLLIIK